MKLKVLLIMTCCWVAPTRLAMALSHAGCEVEAVRPQGHLMRFVRSVRRQYRYNGFSRSILKAIRKSKPDFVIPCDDYATQNLHAIYREERDKDSVLAAMLQKSLGRPESYEYTTARSRLLAVAAELGICVPRTEIVTGKDALLSWLDRNGYPAYLKADGTSGGVGVRMIETREQAEAAFDRLSSPPRFLRMLKRTLIDRDLRLVVPWLQQMRPVLSVQPVIAGPEANCAAACWEGHVVSCISVEVVERTENLGPASVIRPVDHPQMLSAIEKLAANFGLTGLYGLDFILEEKTGEAYLLEMNARATQTSHLSLGEGKNPIASLVHAMEGRPNAPVPPGVTERELIALFPQEWKRDHNSEYLKIAYGDLPSEEPELVRECLKAHLSDRKWRP